MGALRRTPCRRREREDGYVLATAVALMFITILTVMSVITVQLANIAGTRRAAGQLEGRAGGDRALDQAFNALQALSKTNPSAPLPSLLATAGITVSTSASDTWYWYDATTLALCSASSTTCVHFSSSAVGNTNITDYILEVTARTQCRGGLVDSVTGGLTGGSCVVSKYQQRIRKKQFFDYLSVTDTETSPFGGVPVAYVPGDVIRGPIRSNGTFYVCATAIAAPSFLGSVESGASSTFANPNPSPGACSTTANPTPTQRPPLVLPKSTTTFTAIPPSFGETVISSCLSASPGCTPLEVELLLDANGNARYQTRPMNSATWTAAAALPASRVLVVNGDVLVHGTLGNRLTIATVGGGNILINGDLLYKCLKNGWTIDPAADTADRRTALRNLAESGEAAPNCPDEALGLIADQDIRIICGATAGTLETAATPNAAGQYPTTSACIRSVDTTAPATARSDTTNRYMVGAWMAVNGKIVTERWATGGTVGTSTSVPNLYYYGSMTSQNRGVFGLEILSGTRDERGLTKKFRWDETMKDRQPPYFLEPTNETWERVDLVEVAPCGAGLFGQKPQGAGC